MKDFKEIQASKPRILSDKYSNSYILLILVVFLSAEIVQGKPDALLGGIVSKTVKPLLNTIIEKPKTSSEDRNITVEVEQGCLLGEKLELVTGDGHYYSFKGIPYAAPPVGKLRFRDPQPPASWKGIRKATEHGSVCPQYDILTNTYIPGNEDCLYLNVYTPDLCPKKLFSVIVVLHGGGFKSGSGNTDMYSPDFLIKYGVIIVTLNYRLDALGFFCLATKEVPGNAGLKDQVAALKWVKRNIKKFGGNPSKVTLLGQSAGSASIGLHLMSPMSKGLYQQAILMSGVPFCSWAMPFAAVNRAFALGSLNGINTKDPEKLYKALQKIPCDQLVNRKPYFHTAQLESDNLFRRTDFGPAAEKYLVSKEKHFITKSPDEYMQTGNINNVRTMIGYTDNEAIVSVDLIKTIMPKYDMYTDLWVPRQISVRLTPTTNIKLGEKIKEHYFGNQSVSTDTFKEMATFLSHYSFVYDINKFIQQWQKKSKDVYMYVFSGVSERNIFSAQAAKYNTYGAAHVEDLLHLFHAKSLNLPPVDKKSESFKIIQHMCKLFTNFAKFGNPTPDKSLGVIWKPYDLKDKHYLDIGKKLVLGKSHAKNVIKFWDGIYDKVAGEGVKYPSLGTYN